MPARKRTRAPPAPLRWEETTSIVDKYWGEMTSEAIRERVVSVAVGRAHHQLEDAPRNPLHTHRVFRKLYIAFFLLYGFFVLVPLWFLWYWPRFTRPRRSWTAQRCVRVRWSRRICAAVARCEIDWLGRDLSVQLVSHCLVGSRVSGRVRLEPGALRWLERVGRATETGGGDRPICLWQVAPRNPLSVSDDWVRLAVSPPGLRGVRPLAPHDLGPCGPLSELR